MPTFVAGGFIWTENDLNVRRSIENLGLEKVADAEYNPLQKVPKSQEERKYSPTPIEIYVQVNP